MKLHYLHKSLSSNIKFSYNEEKEFLKLWHHHPELELVYIVNGEGTIYAGDFIGNYQKNDFFLIGKNLPHMFHSKCSEEPEELSKSYVFHINEILLNNSFTELPEFNFLRSVTDISKRGILFRNKKNVGLLQLLDSLEERSPSENAIKMFLLLLELSKYEFTTLGSINWLKHVHMNDRRINKVIEYIMLHFQQQVSLEEISEISGMNKSAFCRFFKRNIGKSFISFVNEVRVNYSCKILLETTPPKTVSEACYQSGFNSLSYYNRTFKKIKGLSPSVYQADSIGEVIN